MSTRGFCLSDGRVRGCRARWDLLPSPPFKNQPNFRIVELAQGKFQMLVHRFWNWKNLLAVGMESLRNALTWDSLPRVSDPSSAGVPGPCERAVQGQAWGQVCFLPGSSVELFTCSPRA